MEGNSLLQRITLLILINVIESVIIRLIAQEMGNKTSELRLIKQVTSRQDG